MYVSNISKQAVAAGWCKHLQRLHNEGGRRKFGIVAVKLNKQASSSRKQEIATIKQ